MTCYEAFHLIRLKQIWRKSLKSSKKKLAHPRLSAYHPYIDQAARLYKHDANDRVGPSHPHFLRYITLYNTRRALLTGG